jgi:hypothetical protein
MEIRPEIFSPAAQQALAQEMTAVLQAYMDGLYQNLYFAVIDLISLCQKHLITREMIRLNNHLSFLIDRWQERDVADGGRPTEQEMQAIIAQLMPLVVQAFLPEAIKEEKSIPPSNESPET